MLSSFDYAVVRIVPRVEREEFINAGIVLFCAERNFLGARARLNEARLLALAPHSDLDLMNGRLSGILTICAGGTAAGPAARLSTRERFHWLVSPKSAILQMSAVHSGICEDPEQTLRRLFRQLCL